MHANLSTSISVPPLATGVTGRVKDQVTTKEMLALTDVRCQSIQVAQAPKQPAGGGFFIALGVIGGVVAGRYFGGQTTIGLLAGLAAGLVIAMVIWLASRR